MRRRRVIVRCLVLLALLVAACRMPALENPEDPTSEAYFTMQILRCALGQSGVFCPAPGPVTIQLADTGQTSCYDNTGVQSCPFGGYPRQDADFTFAWNLTSADSGESIVESGSGLVWQKCTMGQLTSACSGAATTGNWATANSYCSNLAIGGRSWRLPGIREMMLFPNYQNFSPAADTTLFLNNPAAAAMYWTSTPSTTAASNYWWLDTQYGVTGFTIDTTSANMYARCVSGTALPASNFRDNGNGTVTDVLTSLTWTQCSMDNTSTGVLQTYSSGCSNLPSGTRVWPAALIDCAGLTLAGLSWRLPSIRELGTLTSYSTSGAGARVDTTMFPGTTTGSYWSSTTSASGTTYGWSAFYNTGVSDAVVKGTASGVRCVAGP